MRASDLTFPAAAAAFVMFTGLLTGGRGDASEFDGGGKRGDGTRLPRELCVQQYVNLN